MVARAPVWPHCRSQHITRGACCTADAGSTCPRSSAGAPRRLSWGRAGQSWDGAHSRGLFRTDKPWCTWPPAPVAVRPDSCGFAVGEAKHAVTDIFVAQPLHDPAALQIASLRVFKKPGLGPKYSMQSRTRCTSLSEPSRSRGVLVLVRAME